MEQTLRQLGELLLGAVPTVILLAALYLLYTFLVYRPLKVFKNLEARRQQATQARGEVVNQARARAQDQVKQARSAIEQDKQGAMAKLETDAGRLASEIVRTVLRPVAAPSQVGG